MKESNQQKISNWRRIATILTISLTSLCMLSLGLILISNQFLPAPSKTPDQLTPADIARAEEALNLMTSLGDQTWPV